VASQTICRGLCTCVCMGLVVSGSARAAVSKPLPQCNTLASADMQMMDVAHPQLVHHVDDATGKLAMIDFVQVCVVEVINPQRIGVFFVVDFQPDGGKSLLHLGSFSLYPADHPGTFIVATKRQLTSAGSIVLSLRTTVARDPSAPLSVTVGAVTLIKRD
jgi:hypothetical protein